MRGVDKSHLCSSKGFNPADPSRPRCQTEFWKEVLLEYLKAKVKLEGVDEKKAASLLDNLYAKVRKMVLVCIPCERNKAHD
jgi:hypothetical protein